MNVKQEANNIIKKGRYNIERELIGYIKRVEYLEGKEFYNFIAKGAIQRAKKSFFNDVDKIIEVGGLSKRRILYSKEKKRHLSTFEKTKGT